MIEGEKSPSILNTNTKEERIVAETENTIIKSFNDFKEQLEKFKNSQSEIVLSYYKYCWRYAKDNDFSFYKDLVLDELEPYGLKPYKVTQNLDLLFKYKDEAEAVIYIKPFGIDLCIVKL